MALITEQKGVRRNHEGPPPITVDCFLRTSLSVVDFLVLQWLDRYRLPLNITIRASKLNTRLVYHPETIQIPNISDIIPCC